MSQQVIKNMQRTALAIAAVAGLTVAMSSQAKVYQDIDKIEQVLSSAANGTHSYSGSFNIMTAEAGSVTIKDGYSDAGTKYKDIGGFVPGGSQLLASATASFYLKNANGSGDRFDIDLNSENFIPAGSGGVQSPVQYYIANGNINIGLISFLYNNGFINYTVTSVKPDGGNSSFTLDYALLKAQTDSTTDSQSVPDAGATSSMIGCAFLALAALRRKLAAK